MTTAATTPAAKSVAPAPVANAATAKTEKTAPEFIGVGVAITAPPKKNNAGGRSLYPFDQLEKGTAFGVKGKVARDLGTVVTNANKKGKTETRTAPDQTPTVTVNKHFYAVDVTPEIAATIKGTALEGSDVLVYRDI